jgi:hypothetical protein
MVTISTLTTKPMKSYPFYSALAGFLLMSVGVLAQDTAPALSAYYELKDALVATDPQKAKNEALTFVSAIKTVKADKLSATVKKALNMASAQATAISKTADIKQQRKQFEGLSTAMITVTKATKASKAYVQYCPMAFDGKGASWLSSKREVRNPYYGIKMSTCGSVKEEI